MASIFTKIINGEIPSFNIYEDDEFFAFLDINPLVIGHTLVIPKQEINYLFDMESGLYGRYMEVVRKLSVGLKEKLAVARICTLVMGYEVPHAHVHLLPTNQMSDLPFTMGKPGDMEQLKVLAETLQTA